MICLTTRRLVLKPLQASDMTRLVKLIGTPEVVNNLSQVPFPYTVKDAEEWLAVVSGEKFNLNIFLDGALIGAVALSNNHDGSYELGY
jgi:RimJ/RimL family protein N-acetyltransferase